MSKASKWADTVNGPKPFRLSYPGYMGMDRDTWFNAEVTRSARCQVTVEADVGSRFGYKKAKFTLSPQQALDLAAWLQDTFGEGNDAEG